MKNYNISINSSLMWTNTMSVSLCVSVAVSAFTSVTAFASVTVSVTVSVTASVTTSVFLMCPCQCHVCAIDRARVCVRELVSVEIRVLRDSVRDRAGFRVSGHVGDRVRDVTVSVPVSLAVQFPFPVRVRVHSRDSVRCRVRAFTSVTALIREHDLVRDRVRDCIRAWSHPCPRSWRVYVRAVPVPLTVPVFVFVLFSVTVFVTVSVSMSVLAWPCP